MTQGKKTADSPQSARLYFPDNLREFLKANRMTQKDLARNTGMVESTISGYCNGNTMPSTEFLIRFHRIYGISIDELLFTRMQTAQMIPEVISEKERASYRKYCGSYCAYYLDTGKYMGADYNSPARSLKFGVLHIYEDSEDGREARFNCCAVMGIPDRENAAAIHRLVRSQKDSRKVMAYMNGHEELEFYIGDVTLTQHHMFLTMKYGEKDRALAIFYRVDSNKTNFKGGIGTINSVSRGRESTPTVQFMGISRMPLDVSEEEIHYHLLLSVPPVNVEEETEEILAVFENMTEPVAGDLTAAQKNIIIRANIERAVRRNMERNLFRYAKVSGRDDDSWYHFVKEESVAEADDLLRGAAETAAVHEIDTEKAGE